MFDPNTSRYGKLTTHVHTTADGTEVPYVERRLLPDPEEATLLAEATVADGERLDQIAGRTLGDSTQWWRIADASRAMDPEELVEEPGEKLRVPVPQP